MNGHFEVKFHGTKAEYEAEIERLSIGSCGSCVIAAQCDGANAACTSKLYNHIEHVPPKRWRAEPHGVYWIVGSDGNADRSMDIECAIDNNRYTLGNYFRTREDAERAAEYVKAAYEHAQVELEGAENG